MSELRYYGFRMEVENASGVKKIQEFRRAVTDVDGTVDMLNSTLGDNVTVTAEKTQGDKEALAQARLLVSQQERQRRRTQQVTDQYKLLNRTIEEYGNDLETVNAVTRLGSNATDEQRREVAQLVQQYQQLRSTGDASRTSMRNLRGAAQNFGWQLQDTVVQLQMGTDAMIVMSQQGSQMLSVFGAWGAIAGAGVAIVGAVMPTLITYLTGAKDSTDELEEAQKRLNQVFDQTGITVNGVSSQIRELHKVNSQLAELQLFQAMADAQMVLRNYGKELKTVLGDQVERVIQAQNELAGLTEGTRDYNRVLQNLTFRASDAGNELGITGRHVIELTNAYREFQETGDNDKLTSVLTRIANTGYVTNESFRELITTYIDLTSKGELAQSQLAELRGILLGNMSIVDSYNKTIETTADRYQTMRRQLSMTDAQIAIDNFLRKEGTDLTDSQRDSTTRLINQYFKEKSVIDAKNEAEKEAERLAKEKIRLQQREFEQIKRSLTGENTPGLSVVEREAAAHKHSTEIIRNAKQEQFDTTVDYNRLIEAENTRHTMALQQAYLTMAQNWTGTLSGFASFTNDMVNEFYNGAEEVKNATEEMDSTQKQMYFIMRSVKAAEALVNGMSLGMKLAELTLNPGMVTAGTGLGAASAGMIMGTTFKGMFDKGGYIPSGSSGIVSEYGDELVNGVMVKGPARVTGREETAQMMSQGDTGESVMLNLSIENYATGVEHRVEQMSANEYRVIAEDVFAKNIDSGVANVLSKKGTKADKAMRSSYNAPRKY